MIKGKQATKKNSNVKIIIKKLIIKKLDQKNYLIRKWDQTSSTFEVLFNISRTNVLIGYS